MSGKTAVLQCAGRNYDWGQTGKLIKQCYQHQILAHQSQLRAKLGYTWQANISQLLSKIPSILEESGRESTALQTVLCTSEIILHLAL